MRVGVGHDEVMAKSLIEYARKWIVYVVGPH